MGKRREDVFAGGGGYAGSLVRMLAEHGRYDDVAIDLLCELVGRVQEAEKETGALQGQVSVLERRIKDLEARESGGDL